MSCGRSAIVTMLVLVDRVDEPTLINGEPERMRALVWPLLNNKFLQQDRVGVKTAAAARPAVPAESRNAVSSSARPGSTSRTSSSA